jgi:hypothetical protein
MDQWTSGDGQQYSRVREISQGRPDIESGVLAAAGRGMHATAVWNERSGATRELVAVNFDSNSAGRFYRPTLNFDWDPIDPTVTLLPQLAIIGWQEDYYTYRRLWSSGYSSNLDAAYYNDAIRLTDSEVPLTVKTIPLSNTEYLLFRRTESLVVQRFNIDGNDQWGSARRIFERSGATIVDYEILARADGTFAALILKRKRDASEIVYLTFDQNGAVLQAPMTVVPSFYRGDEITAFMGPDEQVFLAWNVIDRAFSAVLSTSIASDGAVSPIEIDAYSTDLRDTTMTGIRLSPLPYGGLRQLIWIHKIDNVLHARVRGALP